MEMAVLVIVTVVMVMMVIHAMFVIDGRAGARRHAVLPAASAGSPSAVRTSTFRGVDAAAVDAAQVEMNAEVEGVDGLLENGDGNTGVQRAAARACLR